MVVPFWLGSGTRRSELETNKQVTARILALPGEGEVTHLNRATDRKRGSSAYGITYRRPQGSYEKTGLGPLQPTVGMSTPCSVRSPINLVV